MGQSSADRRSLGDVIRGRHSEILEVDALGRRGDERQLRERLSSPTVETGVLVRGEAALELARLGNSEGVPQIAELFKSSRVSVRFSAAAALGNLSGPGVVEALASGLSDESDVVVSRVAQSLGEAGGESAVTALAGLFANSDAGLRLDAVRALGASNHGSAVGLLRTALTDDSWRVRRAARKELRVFNYSFHGRH